MENSMLEIMEEDGNGDSNQKQELEEIISTVPYSLPVALIKLTIINNYEPLEIEKYYEKILPAFHLLRRSDGSRYQTASLSTVRSAMVTNKLFTKNIDGLYVLNIPSALKIIKLIKNKKRAGEGEPKNTSVEKAPKPKSGKENSDSNMNTLVNIYKGLKANNNNNDTEGMTGKKRKLRKIKKNKEGNKKGLEKFEKTFTLLKTLLKVSASDKDLYSQINFDFSELKDSALGEQKINLDKIAGMLTIFKFYKPFLERCFNSIHIQENMMSKMSDLSSDMYQMDSLFKFDD